MRRDDIRELYRALERVEDMERMLRRMDKASRDDKWIIYTQACKSVEISGVQMTSAFYSLLTEEVERLKVLHSIDQEETVCAD